MSETNTCFNLLETYNLAPECLCLELEIIPNNQQQKLSLNLAFNEQWESLLGGRVKFGLKGGRLQLHLKNCAFSSDIKEAKGFLPLNQEHNLNIIFPIAYSKSAHETNLLWQFIIDPSATILQGSIAQFLLGTIQTINQDCCLSANFNVSLHDLYLTDAEGLWKHDITPNKHSILERTVMRFLLETRFKPYLSYIQFGTPESQIHPPSKQSSETITLQQLQTLIEQISYTNTDNFLELAGMAELELNQDFAGGNLLGTNLSGIDFSGANLAYANFRGADLTDADLSETNLEGAKLSGADLSGAYLENANLSYANLNSASLALANLIGANLSGANLREANLSSVNLNNVVVDQAIFGKNIGLSAEIRENLQVRGAIFDD